MKMVPKTIFMLFGAVLVMGYCARPFATDDAGTVPPVGYELEVGYDFWEEAGVLGLGFKHGITEKMDIGIGFGYNVVDEPKNSFTDASLCLKYGLIPDLFAASITTNFGFSAYDLNGIISHSFAQVDANLNLGYSTQDSTITYSLMLGYNLGRIGLGVEAMGDKDGMQNWLFGVKYNLLENIAIDAGFSSDFDFDEKSATAGLHYEF
ncbi:MAG: hypothetical protein ACUVQ3_02115 [bacterium]